MALPNEFERKLVEQLRHSCKDILKGVDCLDSSDMFLVRWLRARDYDMKRAEKMLRESRRWRKFHKIDRILDNGLDTFFKLNYPLHMGLLDKRGRPVVVLPLGKWNFRGAVRNGMSHRLHTFVIQCVEAIIKSIERRDSIRKPCAMPVTQFTLVMDCVGFQYGHLFDVKVLRCVHHLLTALEANYPEILATCIVVNCPFMLAKTLQNLLLLRNSPTSLERVGSGSNRIFHWFGRDPTLWGRKLCKFIPESEVETCVKLLAREEYH